MEQHRMLTVCARMGAGIIITHGGARSSPQSRLSSGSHVCSLLGHSISTNFSLAHAPFLCSFSQQMSSKSCPGFWSPVSPFPILSGSTSLSSQLSPASKPVSAVSSAICILLSAGCTLGPHVTYAAAATPLHTAPHLWGPSRWTSCPALSPWFSPPPLSVCKWRPRYHEDGRSSISNL